MKCIHGVDITTPCAVCQQEFPALDSGLFNPSNYRKIEGVTSWVCTEGYTEQDLEYRVSRAKTNQELLALRAKHNQPLPEFNDIEMVFEHLGELLADTHFFLSMSNRKIEIVDDRDQEPEPTPTDWKCPVCGEDCRGTCVPG